MDAGIRVAVTFLALFAIVGVVWSTQISGEIVSLNHACIPTVTSRNDAGGEDVSQCLQPSVDDTALRACLLNDAYVGANVEDDRHLLVQCMDDWKAGR